MEDFRDEEDDPFSQLTYDLLEEIKDPEAEKNKKRDEKKTWEDSLVAGGKLLCDKAAVQIFGGRALAIGSQEPSLLTARARESPTFSLSDMESSTAPSTGKKHSSGRDQFFNDHEADLLEHERKKIELEVNKSELDSKKFEAEMELKQAEMEQNFTFHKDAMALKQKDIDTKFKFIEFQISQHQDDMRMN